MKDLNFRLITRTHGTEPKTSLDGYSLQQAESVREFHKSFPMYAPTPLAVLPETAKVLGIGEIYVKNESFRFGLNAFKVLGGSYAIGNYLAGRLGRKLSETGYDVLAAPETRKQLGDITFITATDGNHGRGVAWTANTLGQKSVVHMPKGSAAERLNNIRLAGAEADIIDGNYDDAVRLSRKEAQENGWVIVQDTSWEGYEQIPAWIMQGYCTMGLEAYEQLPQKPTHIFLQAGVGSMAGTIAALFASIYGEDRPKVVIVEPNNADCFYRTAAANDGRTHIVTGEMKTIMAAILTEPALAGLKQELGLNETSRVLFFSTEGDTDRENYRKIVWDGAFPG